MKRLLLLPLAAFIFYACGGDTSSNTSTTTETPAVEESTTADSDDPMANKGIGPVSSITLGDLDQSLADEGEKIYNELCLACHKPTEKFIGPAPVDILERRSPEWIMNMILNPEEMVLNDPIAKALLIEYNMAPMANQGLTEDQARAVLEYFRTL